MIRGDSGSTLQGTRSSIGALPGQCNHKPKKYPEYICRFVGVNRLPADSGPSPIIRECVTGPLRH